MNESKKHKCEKCGKTYHKTWRFCPHCQEDNPDPIIWSKKKTTALYVLAILLGIIGGILAIGLIGTWEDLSNILDKHDLKWIMYIPIAIIVIVIGVFVMDKLSKKGMLSHYNVINECPRCGGKDITIYRRGYDWKKGFWYRMFNVKGGSYIAGMDSNKTECFCHECGKKWSTNFDYRTIRK